MEEIVGRIYEKKELQKALQSTKSELVAVMGRRRVGKTFLIHNYLEQQMLVEFTGVQNMSDEVQLFHFMNVLEENKLIEPLETPPTSWLEAFRKAEKRDALPRHGYVLPFLFCLYFAQ